MSGVFYPGDLDAGCVGGEQAARVPQPVTPDNPPRSSADSPSPITPNMTERLADANRTPLERSVSGHPDLVRNRGAGAAQFFSPQQPRHVSPATRLAKSAGSEVICQVFEVIVKRKTVMVNVSMKSLHEKTR